MRLGDRVHPDYRIGCHGVTRTRKLCSVPAHFHDQIAHTGLPEGVGLQVDQEE
jgi:hypothetical protein